MESNFWSIIRKNIGPIIGIIAISISAIFFSMSRFQKKPSFAVSESEPIAKLIKETDRMTILWDGEHIENVVIVKVAIWNSGRRYIDISDISKTSPICITPFENINILSVETLDKSRPELEFETFVGTDESSKTPIIRIKLLEDEALEKFDGGIV